MKAVALFSGGLDSTLAIKVIKEQGIDIVALNFMSPFCRCDRSNGCNSAILDMAEKLEVECKRMLLGDEYLGIVKNPKHGYGRHFNPCIDCRILKFKLGKKFMKDIGAEFLISGEVLGQRPMSQHRQALNLIDKEAGIEGIILRPLSAKLFEPTIAEDNGWVDREKLLDISGRGRKIQIQLADDFNISDYPCPAGGCLLTDPEFSKRIEDVLSYDDFSIKNIEIIKTGRFFRLTPGAWLVVGRNEQENNKLMRYKDYVDIIFEPYILAGPTAVGKGVYDENLKKTCAKIIAWYTDKEKEVEVKVTTNSGNKEQTISEKALDIEDLERIRV